MTTDYRQIFFTKMQIIAEARTFDSQEADPLFLSLFEAHRESATGVITEDNLTEEEKNITHDHLSSFMYNTGCCYMPISVVSKRSELELLSGMVVFRLEVFPVLAKFDKYLNNESSWTYVAAPFCNKEQNLLRGFKDYEKSKNPYRYLGTDIEIDLGSHALHKHPWWHGRYETASAKEIVMNYKLNDD